MGMLNALIVLGYFFHRNILVMVLRWKDACLVCQQQIYQKYQQSFCDHSLCGRSEYYIVPDRTFDIHCLTANTFRHKTWTAYYFLM